MTRRNLIELCAIGWALLIGGQLVVDAQSKEKPAASKAKSVPPKPGAAKSTGTKVAAPASVAEAKQVVDLRKLVMLKEPIFQTRSATQLTGHCAGEVKPIAELFLAELAKLGCQLSTEPNAVMVTSDYAQAAVLKDGFNLALSVMPQGKAGQVTFSLLNQGNIDVRELPRVEGAKTLFGNQTTAIYTTPKSVADAAKETRQALTAKGWQEFNKPFTQKAESPDHELLQFRQKGVELNASATVSPAQQGQTAIQYTVLMSRAELPAPPDAQNLEFDDYRPYLQCDLPGELSTAVDYFQQAFPEIGFTEKRNIYLYPSGKEAVVVYRSDDHDLVIAELKRTDAELTHAIICVWTAELQAEFSKPKPKAEPAKPQPETHEPNIALPTGIENVKCVSTLMIHYETKKPIVDAVEELRELYQKEKWTENREFSVVTSIAAVVEMKRGDAKLVILGTRSADESTTEIVLSGADVAKKKAE